MPEHPRFKLGKRDARDDDRDLRLARYAPRLLTPPSHVRLSLAVANWPMFRNDELGDCAIADPAHAVELVTVLGQGREAVITDADVVGAYSAVSGYRPGDPSTDNGCVMGEVMDYWRRAGIARHRIDGYARVDPRNTVEVRQAVAFFGGLHLGLSLPVSAQNQVGRTWTKSRGKNGSAGTWGGHAVLLTDYDQHGLVCITWGATQRMTWAFLGTYCDEAFVTLSAEWIGDHGTSPQGIGMDELRNDLKGFR